MSEHKFEPFDRVLVRDVYGVWKPDFYGYSCPGFTNAHMLASGVKYPEVLPYTAETAHLIGTSATYEPPKPPHEYKWGDRVIVDCFAGKNTNAIYLGRATNSDILFIIEDDSLVRQTDPGDVLRPLEPSHD